MARAPWRIPEGRITAMTMDMRKLDFADESFDFCWSTGAIEHIGGDEDFLTHFNEVHRVLKPGGVYALTTVCTFSDDTDRLPHNYYFHPRHLMELAHESRLHPAPVLDCRIREHTLNRPMPERFGHYGFAAGDVFRHPVVALRRGIINVANTVIFTRADGPKRRPEIVGFEQSRAWLRSYADKYIRRLWSDWQAICELDGKAPPQQFPRGTIEVEAPAPVELWSCAIGHPPDKRKEQKFAAGRFSFEARPDRLYIFKCAQPVRARQRRA
jgi:SAM-dependent methyltransferase